MTVGLLYRDPDSRDEVSKFDEAIVCIARADQVRLACPYISLDYLRRIISLSVSWRLLTDVEEWLRSHNRTQRDEIYEFLVQNRSVVRHFPQLHAKVVIGSHAAILGSANLTDSGILRRVELSVLLEDVPKVKELGKWFEIHWKKAYELDELRLDRIAEYLESLPEKAAVENAADANFSHRF